MRKFIAFCMLAAGAVGLQHSPVAAAPEDFDCRGSALRVTSALSTEPTVSNNPGRPCVDDADTLATLNFPNALTPIVRARTLNSSTTAENDSAAANSSVQTVNTGAPLPVIAATAASSHAEAECSATGPAFTGGSSVLGLKIGTQVINVNVPPNTLVPIPANPLLNVRINEQTVSPDGTTFTVRAVHIFSPALGIDIAIAESVASAHDCDVAPRPECSDGGDNADTEDTVGDALDPGCHTDGDPNDGDDTYDPNDDDETDRPECSDGGDNADTEDTVGDALDPGCHTDGDPNDGDDTYDPFDDDETDPRKPQCSDGINNDPNEDPKIDINDPGCHTDLDRNNPHSYDPNDDSEFTGPLGCGDGEDNDGDDLIDAADPGCHFDGDASNSGTYDPNHQVEHSA